MGLLKTLVGLALFSVALADFRVKFNVETTAGPGSFVIKVRGRDEIRLIITELYSIELFHCHLL